MNNLLSLAFLVVGIILLIYGLAAVDSFKDSMSRMFTGNLTDKTMWMIIIGAVCCLIGLGGVFRSRRI